MTDLREMKIWAAGLLFFIIAAFLLARRYPEAAIVCFFFALACAVGFAVAGWPSLTGG